MNGFVDHVFLASFSETLSRKGLFVCVHFAVRSFRVGSAYVSSSSTFLVTSLSKGFEEKVVAATALLSSAAFFIALCWVCSLCVVVKRVTKKKSLRRFRVVFVAAGVFLCMTLSGEYAKQG